MGSSLISTNLIHQSHGNPLTTHRPGGGAPTYTWLMQSGGIDLATGFYVNDGAGNELPLWLGTNSMGVKSAAGFRHNIISNATAIRTVGFSDASGYLYPVSLVRTTADQTNNTVTAAIVPELALFPPGGAGFYTFEAWLLVRSAATTTGVRIDVTGPAQVTTAVLTARGPSTSYATETVAAAAVLPLQYQPTDSPAANTTFLIRISGQYSTNAAATAPINLALYSEVAASTVTLLAGSWVRHTKIG